MAASLSAENWIAELGLVRHPEGGWYRETYRSTESLPGEALPPRYGGPRHLATAIWFLLRGNELSAFHRVRSDELWFYHAGSPLTLHLLAADGALTRLGLGLDPAAGCLPQRTIPADTWFAATVDRPASFTLVSCTVAPGFDFADFALADRAQLARDFPQHRERINRLTKE